MTTLTKATALFTDAASVDSSVLSDVFYDDVTGNLYVRLNRGSLAAYRDVPRHVFEGLTTTGSPGQYWNFYVKGQYRGANGDVNLEPRVVTRVEEAAPATAAPVAAPTTTEATRKWQVTVEVEATDYTDAVDHFRSGNIVGVTRL